ncbi:Mycolic acid cyclopropane synthetase [seawater metagenome]|uniref:Mycolic acid cyclopropane synthetase n=1 Tax=seawater metagenome TaxID=1561972 RepID=A0A5E8CIJ9_9ZZZZ
MSYCIIGTGISGLSTIYYLLSMDPNATATVYEKNKIGGHSYTFELNKDEKIDLAFQVFNKMAYPNMIQLFDNLNIPLQKTDMSFAVSNTFIEWSSKFRSLIRNIFNIKLWSLLYSMIHFNSLSNNFIKTYTEDKMNITMKDFLEENKFSKSFLEGYIFPFCASVWSVPLDKTNDFPLMTLLKFMSNHSLLSLKKDQWYTLKNRSQEYVNKILDKFKDRITLINKSPETIDNNVVDGIKYDHVIFAIHGNDVSNLLPSSDYQNIFKNVKYSKSQCYLHQDTSFMPAIKSDWSSWNFVGDTDFICTYWCNNLQTDLKTPNLFFTLNPKTLPQNILHKVEFSHPILDLGLIKAQKQIEKIQGRNNIWFVGAYLGNGFHEDGVVSALKIVKQMLYPKVMIFYPLRENRSFIHKIIYNFIQKILTGVVKKGTLNLQLPNKGLIRIKNNELSKIEANLVVKSPKFFYSILLRGNLGFAEAYMNGSIETNNITHLLDLFAKSKNRDNRFNLSFIFNFLDKVKFFKTQDNNINNTKKNIADHYDLGNTLYTRFLDPTMTYSSAIFNNLPITFENLEKAQLNKYNRIIKQLDINKTDHVLEIGCGWGGFAIQANKLTGCKITCLTLSEEQKKYFENKIGNNPNIEILLLDYRLEKRKFDKIVSIEMIEAVGINYMDVYFKSIKDNLKIGGNAMIQAICIPQERFDKYSKNVDFIQKYIFPGGAIPSLELIKDKVENQKMKVNDVKDISIDYANTLLLWHQQFEKNWPDIKKNWNQADEHFYKMWKYYFAYCEVGFRNNLIQTYQIKFE